MSTYVMSDIHGCFDEFMQMLNLISFGSTDELYVLGDVIDRGPEPIKCLQYCMDAENIHLLLGNHEYMMRCAYELGEKRLWYENGGRVTQRRFCALPLTERNMLYIYLTKRPCFAQLKVNNQEYVLVHAGITKTWYSFDNFADVVRRSIDDESIIWQRNESETVNTMTSLFPDMMLIHGHTPLVDGVCRQSENVLNIDCACVYGHNLACVRLEDQKVYYVSKSKN